MIADTVSPETFWTGVIAAVSGLLIGVMPKFIDIVKEWNAGRRRSRGEDRKDRADEWERQNRLIDRLEKQMTLLATDQQRSFVAEMASRQEAARLRTLGQWLLNTAMTLHEELKRYKPDVAPLPQMPEFSDLSAAVMTEREYSQRTTEHTTGLLKEAVAKNKEENGK